MQITAAVVRSRSGPFGLETVEIEAPRAGEVLVRVVATGVCHTDMVMRDQDLPTPQPVILGHEGAGVVERVGAGVTKVAPGDHVVMTFNSCGGCPSCRDHAPTYCHEFFPRNFVGVRPDGSTGLSKDGETIYANIFGQSSFATYALCHERNAVKVPKDAPLEILGPLGCGVMTGAGAVMNALKVEAGRSLVVFGAGAVGLSALLAAEAAGAGPIIVVDINSARLELALELGADHALDSRAGPVVDRIREITGVGADYTLDTTANLAVMRQAVDALA
ncbi:NAD(P)-dependent alcohol dehydrogenase, partial [Phenylobacterium sp.]|uniref:NAD(P)-dependent alcohol dehydrogenase n=1 Tax=Phenylobacterium sp. TaxID=1871053 RepID=UPI002EDAA0B0